MHVLFISPRSPADKVTLNKWRLRIRVYYRHYRPVLHSLSYHSKQYIFLSENKVSFTQDLLHFMPGKLAAVSKTRKALISHSAPFPRSLPFCCLKSLYVRDLRRSFLSPRRVDVVDVSLSAVINRANPRQAKFRADFSTKIMSCARSLSHFRALRLANFRVACLKNITKDCEVFLFIESTDAESNCPGRK